MKNKESVKFFTPPDAFFCFSGVLLDMFLKEKGPD